MLEVDVNEHFEIYLLTDIYTHMDNVDDRYDQMIPNAADMMSRNDEGGKVPILLILILKTYNQYQC